MNATIFLQDPHLMQYADGWCLGHERGLNYEKSCTRFCTTVEEDRTFKVSMKKERG